MILAWTQENIIQARHEGWMLIEGPRPQIWSTYRGVGDDKQMRQFVDRRAEENSELHLKAIAIIVKTLLRSS